MPRAISVATRDVLIRHIDGSVPVPTGQQNFKARVATTQAILKGLLEFDPATADRTRLTERGRIALTAALADWADAITRAKMADRRNSRGKRRERGLKRIAGGPHWKAARNADNPLKLRQ